MNTETLLKNHWGSANPYTRHLKKCRHVRNPKHNSCSCPKWLYVNRKGERPRRYALNTNSWAEAKELAAHVLRGFDPEIAEARESKEQKKRTSRTVLEAINLWLDRTRTAFGERSTIVNQYRSTFGWIDKNGVSRGALLRFIEARNAKCPDQQVETIDQVSTLVCQEWLSSKWFTNLSPVTRNQRWGTVRSFFKFLADMGVLEQSPVAAIKAPPAEDRYANAPFTPEQYKCILEQADWYVDERVRDGEREVYCKRLHNFIELLRHTGMDVIDGVQLRPAHQIRYESIGGNEVPVLRYLRTKTGVEAVIPLMPDIAKEILATPLTPTASRGMPFRYQNTEIRSDAHNWSRRISALFPLADVRTIQLTGRDGRPAIDGRGQAITKHPNVKMLRHTFAVSCLAAGMREEAVAKMLGHKSVEMVREHYGPWCQQRDDAHIREVNAVLFATSMKKLPERKTKAKRAGK